MTAFLRGTTSNKINSYTTSSVILFELPQRFVSHSVGYDPAVSLGVALDPDVR